MSLHAYWCKLPPRTVGMSYDPPDPGEYYAPCGIYIAETRGRAKTLFLKDHERAVEPDEFLDVRTACLERYLDDLLEIDTGDGVYPAREGRLPEARTDPPVSGLLPPDMDTRDRLYYQLWGRVHEIEDHGGTACDCPEMEWDEEAQDWREVAPHPAEAPERE